MPCNKCDAVLVVISGPPVEVGVTMYVLSISSLSEVKMVLSHSISFYLRTKYFIYKTNKQKNQSHHSITEPFHTSLSARPLPDLLARAFGGLGKRVGVLCDGCSLAGPPVEVGVTMYVLSISSLSEVQMVLT